MTDQRRCLSNAMVIILPGLSGSHPRHWQRRWELLLPNSHRIEDQNPPNRTRWLASIDEFVRRTSTPILVAAHDLGCLALAWWAKEFWSLTYRSRVVGALLVAPPEVERADADGVIRSFSPAPREALPFPSLLVASRNDSRARFETSAKIAQMWGSDFVDAGYSGHIDQESNLGDWWEGSLLLASLVPQGALPTEGVVPLVRTRSWEGISRFQ